MHIALVTSYFPSPGHEASGVGKHFAVLARALIEAGQQVTVVHVAAGASAAYWEDGYRVERLGYRLPVKLNQFLARRWDISHGLHELMRPVMFAGWILRRLWRGDVPDAIESTNYGVITLPLLVLAPGVPLVVRVSTLAGQIDGESFPTRAGVLRLLAGLERLYLRQAPRLVTHARQHRRLVAKALALPAPRLAISPHAIPAPDLAPPGLGSPPPPGLQFLFVGRFEYRKGVDVLFAALPEVFAVCPLARLDLVGPSNLEWFEAAVTAPPLQRYRDRIRIRGLVSAAELERCYAACDVLVAPSRYESFGLIYLEAMVWGKPVIGTRSGGIPDVITDGREGLLAEPGDARSLARCMIRLAESPALRAQLGAAGRTRAQQQFSPAALAARTLALLRLSGGGITL